MSAPERALSMRRTAAALRATTSRLAAELRQPATDVPRWNEFEWDVARAVAAMHGISVLLANRLRWSGPGHWQKFLADQQQQGRQRDARADALLAQIDAALRAECVAAIALKGATVRKLEVYAAGERPMGDIDLFATHADFPAVSRALATVGYRAAYATPRHLVFERDARPDTRHLGEHISHPLSIELHERVFEELPVSVVDITAQIAADTGAPGLNGYPLRAGLLAHQLLHTAGALRAHALRLIHLVDIARVSATFSEADWRHLLQMGEAGAPPWWALPPLVMARRHAGAEVPQAVIDELAVTCPRWLTNAARRDSLYEVSWSNVKIAALPGLRWSRSWPEALRYVRSRVSPSREARAELAVWHQSQAQIQRIPWYGLPHSVRILRWLCGLAPRVQTVDSVALALATREQDGHGR